MTEAEISQWRRKLKRWEMWGGLWLQRLFTVLEKVCGEPRGFWRDWFKTSIKNVSACIMVAFVCDVFLDLEPRPARGFDDPRDANGTPTFRAAIGSALRRAFRAKTILGRLTKIRRALEQREVLIARLQRRLALGLTRIYTAYTRAPIGADVALVTGARSMPVRGADTS